MTLRRWLVILAAAVALALPDAAGAQSPVPADTLTAREARLALSRAATAPTLVEGDTRIAPGQRVWGALTVVRGWLEVEGAVAGDVVVVSGDVYLGPDALVDGDLLVLGGRVEGAGDAVRGRVAVAPEAPPYEVVAGRLVAGDVAAEPDVPPPGTEGRADILFAAGRGYNRVEGMPITIGPVVETGGANPLHLRGLLIYRTEAGWSFRSDDIGYYLRGEQYLGGHRAWRAGITLHSLIEPIEAWKVSDLENGLATFLFRQDQRDHYDRQGWAIFADHQPPGHPLSLGVEVRFEKHGSEPAGSPLTLFRNEDPWRPQPLVAEGSLHTLVGRAALDRRDRPDDPAFGWIARVEVEQTLSPDLAIPAHVPLGQAGEPPPVVVERVPVPHFGRAWADVRQYNRIGPGARLNFRAAGGGRTFGTLPPQRQYALGGAGTLPGFPLFALDCGARQAQVLRLSDAEADEGDAPRYFGSYGCDRFLLLQAEYRGKLSLRFQWPGGGWQEDDERAPLRVVPTWDAAPDWVAFFDAGRAWSERGSEELALDLGLGIAFQRLGVYLAVPLTSGGSVRLFGRVGPRF
jgi:hypothetical protein